MFYRHLASSYPFKKKINLVSSVFHISDISFDCTVVRLYAVWLHRNGDKHTVRPARPQTVRRFGLAPAPDPGLVRALFR